LQDAFKILKGLFAISHGTVHHTDIQCGTGHFHRIIALLPDGKALFVVTQCQVQFVLVVVGRAQAVHDERGLPLHAQPLGDLQRGLLAANGVAIAAQPVQHVAQIIIRLGQ